MSRPIEFAVGTVIHRYTIMRESHSIESSASYRDVKHYRVRCICGYETNRSGAQLSDSLKRGRAGCPKISCSNNYKKLLLATTDSTI